MHPKSESKTLTCVPVCVRVFVCERACVSLLRFLFVLLFCVGLFVFVFHCSSVLFALSNCCRVQKQAIGCTWTRTRQLKNPESERGSDTLRQS